MSIYTNTGNLKSQAQLRSDTWAAGLTNKNLMLHLLHPSKKQSFLETRALLGEFKMRFGISLGDFKNGKRSTNAWLNSFKVGQEVS